MLFPKSTLIMLIWVTLGHVPLIDSSWLPNLFGTRSYTLRSSGRTISNPSLQSSLGSSPYGSVSSHIGGISTSKSNLIGRVAPMAREGLRNIVKGLRRVSKTPAVTSTGKGLGRVAVYGGSAAVAGAAGAAAQGSLQGNTGQENGILLNELRDALTIQDAQAPTEAAQRTPAFNHTSESLKEGWPSLRNEVPKLEKPTLSTATSTVNETVCVTSTQLPPSVTPMSDIGATAVSQSVHPPATGVNVPSVQTLADRNSGEIRLQYESGDVMFAMHIVGLLGAAAAAAVLVLGATFVLIIFYKKRRRNIHLKAKRHQLRVVSVDSTSAYESETSNDF